MESPAMHQRMTLSDQLSLLQTSNIHDLLTTTTRRTTRTLANILQAEKSTSAPAASSAASSAAGGRTLLDVIREEEESERLRIELAARSAAASDPRRSDGTNSIRVSLMTLMEVREREEEIEEKGKKSRDVFEMSDDDVAEKHVCCVCMGRKKGAAFIPCGHTFCRVCSRELMAARGNCPLCNASILDILDIF